jgi:hypothetical protein
LIGSVQRGLERLYRVETDLEVEDFLIDESHRDRMGVERRPREQLLVSHDDDGVSMGLFVDARALTALRSFAPRALTEGTGLEDFMLVVEGVSHFVFLAWRARADRPVSALELELQAEVDKYVTCVLSVVAEPERSPALRRRLFEEFELVDDLEADERERYRVANANAHRYSASLEQRFVRPRRLADMLVELRRFYRLSLDDKLDLIRAA